MKPRKTKSPARLCGNCGAGVKTARKIANGIPYCEPCYFKVFIKTECSKCSGSVRALRNDLAPVCAACSREGRTCLRCEKPVPRASLRVGNQVACASCAPHFRRKETCERCGSASSRLSKIVGVTDQRLCPRCRAQELNVTCASCGKYRIRFALTISGQAVCKSCASAPGESHACPDCGISVGGVGNAPCRPCGFVRSLRRRATSLAGLLKHDASRALLDGFSEWCIRTDRTSKALAKFDQYGTAIAKLDKAFGVGGVLHQTFVASHFSQEELRRAGLFAHYLAEVGLHPPREVLNERLENQKLDILLTGIRGEVFEKSVCEYAVHLKANNRALTARSIRIYVEAAVRLSASAQARGAKIISQGEVNSFLRRNAGYRTSLSQYLKFLNASAAAEIGLRVPVKSRRAESMRAARESVVQLLQRLKNSSSQRTRTALTAKLLAQLYGVRLRTILSMKREDVREKDGRIEVRLGDWLALSPEISQWIRDLWQLVGDEAADSDWLFRGRVGDMSLSTAAVKYQLNIAANTNLPSAS